MHYESLINVEIIYYTKVSEELLISVLYLSITISVKFQSI